MSAALETPNVTPPPAQGLGQRALSLGAANAIDYAVQFLLPVVLVRCLDSEAFGQYRLLWLMVGTVLAFLPMAVQGSLYYYLPRSDETTKRVYINQTLLFLVAVGLIAAWAVSAWSPWLPEKLRGIADSELVVPAFMFLWIVASLLDLLPTIEERVAWQAKATISLAVIRAVSLSLAAVLTGELAPVLLTLFVFVVFKLALLLRYISSRHGLRGPVLRWSAFVDQLKFAAPFWAAGALFSLRAQADQWVAATLFSLHLFAAFSIAAVLGPLVNVCRQSVNNAFLPSMSRLQAAGSVPGMLDLNSRANVMVAAIVFPLLALAFVFAEEIVTIVYTETFVDAAPVMRVAIIGLAILVVELASLSLLLRMGTFMMWVNLAALVVSVPINWQLAKHFGLPGAAVGTVIVIYLDRIATLWRVSVLTGAPVRRLQDWRTLAVLAFISALAAALAWAIVVRYLAESGPLVRAVVGAAILGTAYGTMRLCFGLDRGFRWIAREPREGT